MDWLQLWAMLKVLGTVIPLTVLALFVLLALVADWNDKRKDR